MEIRARYMLIGGFVLAFALGMFGFVYWIKNTGGLTQRASYQIRFEQPVAGLAIGSSVLFNGVRVGAISELRLDPQHPKRLDIVIGVDRGTPIRADTQVDVSYQGLTGAPAIALKGGDAGAPALTATERGLPVLVAGPDVGQNLTEAARGTLHHIDTILTDNSKELHTAISGFSHLRRHARAQFQAARGHHRRAGKADRRRREETGGGVRPGRGRQISRIGKNHHAAPGGAGPLLHPDLRHSAHPDPQRGRHVFAAGRRAMGRQPAEADAGADIAELRKRASARRGEPARATSRRAPIGWSWASAISSWCRRPRRRRGWNSPRAFSTTRARCSAPACSTPRRRPRACSRPTRSPRSIRRSPKPRRSWWCGRWECSRRARGSAQGE